MNGIELKSHQSSFWSFGVVEDNRDAFDSCQAQLTKTQSVYPAHGGKVRRSLQMQQSLLLPAQELDDEELDDLSGEVADAFQLQNKDE